MENTNEIRQRDQIPAEDKWAIEDLYATDELWEQELATIADDQATLQAFAGHLSDSAETLWKYLDTMEKVNVKGEKLANYCMRKSDEDTRVAKYQAMVGSFMNVFVGLSAATSFETPEILSISDEKLDAFYNSHHKAILKMIQIATDNAHKAANQLVWFVGLSSLVITGIVYIGQNFILHTVFGKIEPDVMQSARIYLLIVAASIPFIALYNAGAAIFRVMGNSKVSMKVSIIMNIINVCGNAVLIYGFHRGTEGVAIPTLVSRMVACIMILVLLAREKGELYLERTLRFHPDKGMIKRILSIGIPNSLENSMF